MCITKKQFNIDGKIVSIPLVNINDLNKVLNFNEEIDCPKESLDKPFNEFKMEINDSPIFRYIYRNFKPRRHLEFGTWQGIGTLYCLQETEATVWTLNLPFGEKNISGDNVYGNYSYEVEELQAWAKKIQFPAKDVYPTDSIGFTGRKYLQENLGHRVCQIYCDSTLWDTKNYPDNFFDTVLIDGGHTKEIVANDTKKAFQVLKNGGLIMWHDFCPPISNVFETTKGVMEGVIDQWDFINSNTEKLFWVEPSWILVGIKK
ncbi:class I SAM-dependent methyltransferase [Clostridium sp. OS1-26]|uniref:class I SAM-dependent methyltransferase n=1 Tax=Clostridium sp. OS1-26 TaxID=3070681 RepID=UPI0027E0418B|nr:class I SAM-dependent methyltransferase [Clostridium sp. OS1-26]WML35473.1 class I SAM-dependent methyltransferase [Clostridium sp. OS1-26]